MTTITDEQAATIARAQRETLEAAARATLDRLIIARENATESDRLWGDAQKALDRARDAANRDAVNVANAMAAHNDALDALQPARTGGHK